MNTRATLQNTFMKSFTILEVTDPKWEEIIANSKEYDFYHTSCYHALEKENRPILAVAHFEDDFIAIPLLIRKIGDSEWYDCTSVYGYCGPISSCGFEDVKTEHIQYFQTQLIEFFNDNKIVSVFSRLHPLMKNDNLLENFGNLIEVNKTIAIDLRLTEEEQKKQYRKSLKYDINQLRKKGYYVTEASSKEEVDAFVEIYIQTMKRVAATEDYFFDANYFYDLLNNNCFATKLLLVKWEDKICAGAIFTITNNIIQYHLAGTALEFISYSPMKLILDEARSIGSKLKLYYLHLGGGAGGSDQDSLFRFKSGFSNFSHQYKNWQLIVNQKKYKELTKKQGTDKDSCFFPAYRANPISKSKVYILGASGHAKVVIDILNLQNEEIEAIIDDNPKSNVLLGIPVLNYKDTIQLTPNNTVIVAIGENSTRKLVANRLKRTYKTAIHPKATISNYAEINQGTVIMAHAVVNSAALIGKHVIINTGVIVEHDCIIEDYAHISPNAALAGNVFVGEGSQIGISACVRQGIKIGKWATVGAGAVIVKDVPDYAVVVGNPGRILKYNEHLIK